MIHYQGEDIEFAISLTNLSENDMKSWNDAKRIVAYFYTHESYISKFSSVNEVGYNKLIVSSDTMLTGCIKSTDTKLMHGSLFCDIYLMPAHGDIEQIRRVCTGIIINHTPIKSETK